MFWNSSLIKDLQIVNMYNIQKWMSYDCNLRSQWNVNIPASFISSAQFGLWPKMFFSDFSNFNISINFLLFVKLQHSSSWSTLSFKFAILLVLFAMVNISQTTSDFLGSPNALLSFWRNFGTLCSWVDTIRTASRTKKGILFQWYRVSHLKMSDSKWLWGVEGSIIFWNYGA